MAKSLEGLKTFERAFERHHRPQKANIPDRITPVQTAPTKKIISTKAPPGSHDEQSIFHKGEPWPTHVRLGQLLQGSTRHDLCVRSNSVVMIKRVERAKGKLYSSLLRDVCHDNVLSLREVFEANEWTYLSFEYYRYTLQELLCVPLTMYEPQLRVVACSIFVALRHLAKMSIAHRQVHAQSIRVCGRTGKVVLAGLEKAQRLGGTSLPNTDLPDLALVLLNAMHVPFNHLNLATQQDGYDLLAQFRKHPKWRSCAALLGFIKDLLDNGKLSATNFGTKYPFIPESEEMTNVFEPYIELVPLSCFTVWHPNEDLEA